MDAAVKSCSVVIVSLVVGVPGEGASTTLSLVSADQAA
jgi:hypothetical protein